MFAPLEAQRDTIHLSSQMLADFHCSGKQAYTDDRILFTTLGEHILLTDETTVGSSLTPCETTVGSSLSPYPAWYGAVGPVGPTGECGERGPVDFACHGVLTICCAVNHPGPKGVTVKEYFESIGQTKLPKQISRQPKQRNLPQYSRNRRKNFR